jgi:chlorite dismutase
MRPQAAASEYPKPDNKERTPRQFITFSFYKLDTAWRHLPAEQQQSGREEFISVVKEFQESGTVVVPYSCVGLRADADLLLWRIDYKLERLQQMSTRIAGTGLGQIPQPVALVFVDEQAQHLRR